MIKNLKKIALIGSLILAGGVYTGGSFENNPNQRKEDFKKLSNFLGKQYELCITSELERKLKEEKEKFSKPLYLSPDLLNAYIKQAYANNKVWPKEFDKRLFRLQLKRESNYNAHAVSKTGYLGLGQQGYETLETLRPEIFNTFKNPITGEIDSLAVKRYLFNPVTNLELSLETLDYSYKFCAKFDPNWKQSDVETRRKKMLFCYNAGIGTAKEYNFNWTNKELPKENRDYPEKIMNTYYDPKVKVKI
jgi:soluble lytic murein transglycosylase-like protein